jgi:hypothetical protein
MFSYSNIELDTREETVKAEDNVDRTQARTIDSRQ